MTGVAYLVMLDISVSPQITRAEPVQTKISFMMHVLLCFFLPGNLDYSDDTAMARCVVQSILSRAGFDERDMARRYMN